LRSLKKKKTGKIPRQSGRGTAHTTASVSSSSGKAVSFAFVTAIYFLLLYMSYSLLIRIFNFVALTRFAGISLKPLGPPFSLPFILGGELAIGAFFAGFLYFGERFGMLRYAAIALATLYLTVLAADQMAFKLFFSHLDFSLYEESHDIGRMWSSIVDSIDVFFIIDAIVALGIGVALWWKRRPGMIRRLAAAVAKRPVIWVACASAYIALAPLSTSAADQHDLENTLLGDVLTSVFAGDDDDEEMKAEQLLLAKLDGKSPDIERLTKTSADDLTAVSTAAHANKKPLNVIYYVIESSPLGETSLADNPPYDTTPFLKQLADDGLFFKNYYNVFPGSTRGVFTSLTGTYPYLDAASDIGDYAEIDVPSLPDALHQSGYKTAFFSSSDTFFDSFDNFLTRRAFDHYMDVNLLTDEQKKANPTAFWGVDEEVMIDMALKWAADAAKDDKPFFLNYVAVFPHHPYKIPARASALKQRDFGNDEMQSRYRASLAYADSAVRLLYEGLKKLGLADNTLFVVTPDHGEAFADLHARNRLHAEYVYEENVHTFLIMHNRKALGAPKVATRLACQTDLLPTILDVLGIKKDLPVDGSSLVAPKMKDRILYFTSRRQEGIRWGNLKAIWRRRSSAVELYNLSQDPTEQHDLSRQGGDKIPQMRAQYFKWKEQVNAHYAALKSATGLSEDDVKHLNMKKRQEIFGVKTSPVSDTALCRSGEKSAPFSACSEPTVKSADPLFVRLLWNRSGSYEARALVFSPDGKLLTTKSKFFNKTEGEGDLEIRGVKFDKAGRYKVRVLVLEFNVIQGVKTHYFRIAE
jgi:phosphoglycerol transferase MdoB-like AlkP superfamily enzyme